MTKANVPRIEAEGACAICATTSVSHKTPYTSAHRYLFFEELARGRDVYVFAPTPCLFPSVLRHRMQSEKITL